MDLKLCVLLAFVSVLATVRTDKDCNEDNCYATTDYLCNERGTCDCGTCTCEPPYHGLTCEECPTCQSPCELFKGCVSCKMHGTGLLGPMECLSFCGRLANYYPMEKAEFDIDWNDTDIMLCEHINMEMCLESFKIGGMTDGYRDLYVRSDTECPEHPTRKTNVPIDIKPNSVTTAASPDTTTETLAQTTTTEATPSGNPQTTAQETVTDSGTKSTKTMQQTKQKSKDKLTVTASVLPTTMKQKKTKQTTVAPAVTGSVSEASEVDQTTQDIDSYRGKKQDNDKHDDNNSDGVVRIDIEDDVILDDSVPEIAEKAAGSEYSSSCPRPVLDSLCKTTVLAILCSAYVIFWV